MPNVVLTTEEYCQNAHRSVRLVDVKPVDCSIDGQVSQPGQDVVVAFPSMRSAGYTRRSGTDSQHSRRGMIERAVQAVAEIEIAVKQMIEYQLEVVFRFSRKLKSIGHGRGACRQSSG